jgi:hypothetical protein
MSSTFYIVSKLNGLVLSANVAKQGSGISMNEKDTESPCQKWNYTKENYFCLAGTECILDIDKQNTKAGAGMILWAKRDRKNQKWQITSEGYMESELNGLVIDIVKSDPNKGAKLWMWTKNKSSNQTWKFIDIFTGEELFTKQKTSIEIYPKVQFESPSVSSPLNSFHSPHTPSYLLSPLTQGFEDLTLEKSIEDLPLLYFDLGSFMCPLTHQRMKDPVILFDSGFFFFFF